MKTLLFLLASAGFGALCAWTDWHMGSAYSLPKFVQVAPWFGALGGGVVGAWGGLAIRIAGILWERHID